MILIQIPGNFGKCANIRNILITLELTEFS